MWIALCADCARYVPVHGHEAIDVLLQMRPVCTLDTTASVSNAQGVQKQQPVDRVSNHDNFVENGTII